MTIERKITILGQHISLIRPNKPTQPIICKSDLPKAKYNTQPKTNKENSGPVAAIYVMLKNGAKRGIRRGTHIDILDIFNIGPEEVAKTGWRLESGKFVWR